MKTMQLDTKVVRVDEDKVGKKVSEGWKFVPKSVWKEKVRDVNKEPEVNQETGKLELTKKKNNEMSRATKRHLRKSNK